MPSQSFLEGNITDVAWNDYLQQYVAIYSPPFSRERRSPHHPQSRGPLSASLTAFVAVQPTSGNVYDAHAHAPQVPAEPGAGGQNTSEYALNKSQAPFNRGLTALSVESSVLPAPAAR